MAIQRFNAVGGYSTGLTATAVIDAIGNITGVSGSFTGTLTGVTANFTGLLSASKGISASALTVSGGVTFSGNVYLGDVATGVTADSNDFVRILGGTLYKSGFYQTYKVLAPSTTGIICTTPTINNPYPGSSTLEITIQYLQTIAGPFEDNLTVVHKILMPITFDFNDDLILGDYTESIVKSSSGYTPVTFTFTANSFPRYFTISTTTPVGYGASGNFVFRTTIQVH